MTGNEQLPKRRENKEVRDEIDSLFPNIFLLSLKLENISNRTLQKDDLTIKQFLLIASIESFDHAPSIKEVAEKVSTSHQSVKEIANRLEKRGFISIEKDPNDKRVLRLRTTQKNWDYWESRLGEHEDLIFRMFEIFSNKEIHQFNEMILRFVDHLQTNFNVGA
jgi:DNA-binding MarR family transcriptional regulator